MTRLTIDISDDVRKRLEIRAAEGGFDSLQAYVQAVLHASADNEDVAELEQLLLDRVQSGPSVEMTDADFDSIRGRLEAEIATRRRV